jgi:hypothetical protein
MVNSGARRNKGEERDRRTADLTTKMQFMMNFQRIREQGLTRHSLLT